MKLGNRIDEIDIVKGLGIILVVALHVGIFNPFWNNFFVAFHMALFIICSGFCFGEKSLVQKPYIYICKKLKTLYLPYLLINGLFLILNNFLISINIYTNNEEFANASDIGVANSYGLIQHQTFSEMLKGILGIMRFGKGTQLGGATWFLRSLFFISVLFFLVSYFFKKVFKDNTEQYILYMQMIVAIILLAIGWYGNIHQISNSYNLLTSCSLYFAYLMGYMFRKKTELIVGIKTDFSLIIFVVSFISLILITPYANVETNTNSYSSIECLVASSILGFLMMISISNLVMKTKYVRRILEILGKYSLYIMSLHFISFKVVSEIEVIWFRFPKCYLAGFPVLITKGVRGFLYTIVGLVIPVFIGKIVQNIQIRISKKNKQRDFIL